MSPVAAKADQFPKDHRTRSRGSEDIPALPLGRNISYEQRTCANALTNACFDIMFDLIGRAAPAVGDNALEPGNKIMARRCHAPHTTKVEVSMGIHKARKHRDVSPVHIGTTALAYRDNSISSNA